MKRRTAVKYLFVVAAGSAILPSCLHKQEKPTIVLKHLDITHEQQKTLREIAATIIPTGAAPGAKDTYAHLFALQMVDDCYETQMQKTFLAGLKSVEEMTEKRFATSFLQCSGQQQNEIVNILESKNASKDAIEFYKMMKELTIRGYVSSKPVLGDIFKYELIPARYNGFFPVKTITHQV